MKIKNKLIAILSLIVCVTFLTACSANNSGNAVTNTLGNITNGSISNNNSSTTSNSSKISTTGSNQTLSVKFDTEDYYLNWKSQSHQTVNLNSNSATISKSGIYEITGTLKDGSLVIDIDKTIDKGIVYLVLNNANLSSTTSAPIYIKDAKKVVIILENGTTNTIYQGSGTVVNADGDPSAAIFSKSDLTITGSGTLNITSDFNDGITSKDKLKITDGTIVIKSKTDGIVGKDLLAIEKANIKITAGKDGMRTTNDTDIDMGNIIITDGSYTITANNDAIQASGVLQVCSGIFNLITGGGYSSTSIKTSTNSPGGMGSRTGQTVPTSSTEESMKGLKATSSILINGGTFTLSSIDDSIHSNGDVTINGGTFAIATGDDGIHSDTNVNINGGTVEIKNCNEGIEGINIIINNGKISLTSSDDGFNVNNSSGLLTINGGETYMNVGGDGVDSNGSVKMTGGIVYVDGPTENNNGAIDYDGKFAISGGTIIAAGSSGMAESPDTSSSQPSILMYYSSAQAAGTPITLKDSNDKVIATFTPTKQYASVAISASNLKTGSSYTLYKGNTKVVTFTLSTTVTYFNESGVTTNQSGGPGSSKPSNRK